MLVLAQADDPLAPALARDLLGRGARAVLALRAGPQDDAPAGLETEALDLPPLDGQALGELVSAVLGPAQIPSPDARRR